MQRLLLICSLITLVACEFPRAFGEVGEGTRMSRYSHCVSYCDAVMPCDNVVSDDFRDYSDCVDTCEGVTDSIFELASGCEFAHQELMSCLSTLTCEESLDFRNTGPGEEELCGEEELQMLECQR